MGSVNAQMNPAQLQNTLKNFEMESSKMDMKEEMSKLKNDQSCKMACLNLFIMNCDCIE